MPRPRPVTAREFKTLADFRYAMARFLRFSEDAAEGAGLASRQYQALLALKGKGDAMSIGDLAERLHIHHHSAVGLVDRLEALGLVARTPDPADARRVRVTPTKEGDARVGQLAAVHREELKEMAGTLQALLGLLDPSASDGGTTGARPKRVRVIPADTRP
ncbi:MAG: MarR family transcriptional regulator [Vicinamibacteria bacterium]